MLTDPFPADWAAAVCFAPILGAVCLGAVADLGLRIHGGMETPTSGADAVLAGLGALGRHAGWVLVLAAPLVLATAAVLRGARRRARP